MGNSRLAKFVKLRVNTSIVDFNLIKVVGQKTDDVINMEYISVCFLKLLKGLTAWSQEKLKNKNIESIFVILSLKFPENLGEKSNIMYLIEQNHVGEKWRFFFEILPLFPVDHFPRWILSPVNILPYEKLSLLNRFFQVEIKAEDQIVF